MMAEGNLHEAGKWWGLIIVGVLIALAIGVHTGAVQ